MNLFLLIFNRNLPLVITVAIVACLLLVASLILIFKKDKTTITKKNVASMAPAQVQAFAKQTTLTSELDYAAIAGEDIFATQLDLAHAYIQLGRLADAKQLLFAVIETGTQQHQLSAQHLLQQLDHP